MNIEICYCCIVGGDSTYIEKPGTITISGNTIRVDDFVFVVNDGSGHGALNELIIKFIEDRLQSIQP